MVKWPVLLLELAVLSAAMVGGVYWYNRPAPTAYDAGCTTIVCVGQKADENEQPDVTAPVTQAPNTTLMEGNLPAPSPEEVARDKREHLLPNGAPETPVTRHRVTASRTLIRHHGMRRPATIRTRSPVGRHSDVCSQIPGIAWHVSRADLIAAMDSRGVSAAKQAAVLRCVGK